MDTDVNKICPNCFKMEFEDGQCSCCGFKNRLKTYKHQPLPAGHILHSRYIVGRILGEGGFGTTYKVFDITCQTILAVKEYAPLDSSCRKEDRIIMTAVNKEKSRSYRDGVNNFLEEATLLRSMGEIPAVVQIKDCFLENGTAYFAMEFLDGSTLKQVLRVSGHRLSHPVVTRIISTVGLAMHAVHVKTKILHLDISPENIYILKDETVKLIDFGSAKRIHDGIKAVECVFLKPYFAPPEQYFASASKGSYTDVYALASTYYYALSGILIPKALDRKKNGESYVRLKDMGIGVDKAVSDAVDRALLLEPEKRIQTMLEFVTAINPERKQVEGNSVTNKMTNKEAEREKQCVSKQEIRPEPPELLPFLEVKKGQNTGRICKILPDVVLKLGRLSECDLCFDRHSEISKIHCTIYYDSATNQFVIRDMGSTNGTFLNGVRVEKKLAVNAKAGTMLALASDKCVVELGCGKGK